MSDDARRSTRSVGRPRDPDVDKRAIEGVLALYSESGLAGLSFEKVAKHSAVGKAALYSRWGSVEELLIDALRVIAPPPLEAATSNVFTDLRQLVIGLADLYSGPYGRITVRINLDAAVRPDLRRYYDEFISSYAGSARLVVERSIAKGDLLPDTDPTMVLEQLFGATMLRILFFGSPDRPMTLAQASQFADDLVTSVLSGVQNPAATQPQ